MSACLRPVEQALVQEWARQEEFVRRTCRRFPHVDRVLQAILVGLRVYTTRADLIWSNGSTESTDLARVRDTALFLRWRELGSTEESPCNLPD